MNNLTTGNKIDDEYNDWANGALVKDDTLNPEVIQAVSGSPRVTGFTKGVTAGWQNTVNMVLPNVYGGYKETEGVMAGIGASLGNPINDIAMLAPVGLIAGSVLGAVTNTVTDYVSKKMSDENAEYSYQDLAEQTLTGAGLGLALKGALPLVKGLLGKGTEAVSNIKSKITGNKLDINTVLPDIRKSSLDVADTQFITPKAVQDDALARNGILKLDDAIQINTNNPYSGMKSSEINDIIKPTLPKQTDILPDNDKLLSNYVNSINADELPTKLTSIKDAVGIRNLYGDEPSKVGFAYNNLKYNYRNKYLSTIENTFRDKESYKFAKEYSNKRELFYAIFNNEVSPTASKIGGMWRTLNKEITDDINIRGSIGYIDNRIGTQIWSPEVLRFVEPENMLKDMVNSGYRIKTEDGFEPLTLEYVKYMKNNLSQDKVTGNYTIGGSKSRTLFTDNADGAFQIERKYGGDKPMLEILNNNVYTGSKTSARTGMFGENHSQTLNSYINIIPEKYRSDMNNLFQTISPPQDGSHPFLKDVVSTINAFYATGKVVKSVFNPLWQVAFSSVDTVGSLATAISRYNGGLFKGLFNSSLPELKAISQEMSKYSKLNKSFLQDTRELVRNNGYEIGQTKYGQVVDAYTSKLLSADVKMNGSHLADTPVRKVSAILFGVGERQRILNGGTIGNIDRSLVLEAMEGGTKLPNADVLLNKAKELKSAGDLGNSAKYAEAGNAINSYLQEAITLANPLVYHNFFNTPKGSLSNIMPLRMGRWVYNTWYNINGKILSAMGKNIINGDYKALAYNLGALASYGAMIGVSETFFDYLRNPKDFKNENDFINALAKNTAIGMTAGSLYIPAMTAGAGYNFAKNLVTGDFEKASKSSSVLQAVNAIHKGLQ